MNILWNHSTNLIKKPI